jgi:hypothetical protein
MRHPAARWLVLVVAVAVAAGLGYRAALLEQHGIDARRGLIAAATEARALQGALSDARRALAAMASPGQPAVSWSRQVATAIAAARTRVARLVAVPGGAGLAAATERLDRLLDTEARLRDFAVGGRSMMASDVAFGEALPYLDAVDVLVADALAQMNASAERDLAALRNQQMLALAGALGTLALAALVLAPAPRPHTDEAVAMPAAAEPATADLALDLGRATPLAALPGDPTHALAPGLDLAPVAAVCGELARLADGAALPAVLERVAPAIGAKGIVVWLAGADRRALQVAASCGYDPRLVERFPAVPVTDDNPTARAFASGAPSVAPGRSGQPAAVAAPIVGSKGPVGVLSLELLTSGAPAAEVVAVAGIVAAQLATLLEPLPRGESPAPGVSAQQG